MLSDTVYLSTTYFLSCLFTPLVTYDTGTLPKNVRKLRHLNRVLYQVVSVIGGHRDTCV